MSLLLRRLYLALFLIMALSAARAQAPQRVINGAGSFVRVEGGWKCTATHPKFVPPLLSQLSVGDVLVRIGGLDLSSGRPLVLAEGVRRAELGIVSSAAVMRNGQRVSLVAPPELAKDGPSEIVVSQESPEVLRSTVKGIEAGSRLESLGGKSWTSLENTFRANSTIPFVNINFKAPVAVTVTVSGKASVASSEGGVTLTGVRLPKFLERGDELVKFLDSVTLHGLNTSDATLKQARGRWLLVHFWASWCRPCVLEAPSIAELSKVKDLTVVAVGYTDDVERLREFGAKLPGFPVYAPDAVLASELAVNGVPFDVLINPDGNAVAAVSGTLPEGLVQKLVLSYLEP